MAGGESKLRGGGQEDIGCRLFVQRFFPANHRVPAFRRQTNLAQVRFDLDTVRAGRHRDAQSGLAASLNHLAGAGERPKLFWNQFEINLVGPRFGGGKIERKMMFLRHATDVPVLAHADERQEILRLNHQPLFFEHRHGRGVNEWLGIRQHAVHVEDHRTNVSWLPHPPRLNHGASLRGCPSGSRAQMAGNRRAERLGSSSLRRLWRA